MGGSTCPHARRHRALAIQVALLCLLALVGPLAVGRSQPAAADDAAPAGNPTQAALLQAQSSGQPVTVDALTTSTDLTVANPDGSLTTTSYQQPVRLQKNGSWTDVSAALQANGDGSYSPAATPNGVKLSGGGFGPLATLTDAIGHSLSLTMPFTLPAPTVSGDTALYPSVLDGVDLSVTVSEQGGISEVLIVHDATAAANPQLKQLTLAATTQGLSLAGTPNGGMTATAADGTTAYTSAAPMMWDSSAGGSSATASQSRAALSTSGTDDEETSGPAPGAQVAPVAMTTASSGLTLTPNADMLTSSSTTWPVYIDPAVAPSETTRHYFEAQAGCDSSSASKTEYDYPQTNGEGVGYQRYSSSNGECIGAERTFYDINIGNLTSAMDVLSSTFHLTETYAEAYSCSHTAPLTLKVVNSFSSGVYWGTQPSAKSTVGTTNPSSAYNGAYAAQPTSCGDKDISFNVTSQVNARTPASDWYVGLYGNEDSSSSDIDFMRFSTNPYLTTTYDIAPGVPSSLSTTPDTQNPSGAQCGGTNRGYLGQTALRGGASDISLNAKVSSPISGENIRAEYTVWDDETANSSGNATTVSNPTSGYVASGTTVRQNIGIAVKDGHQYGWQVRAYDGTLRSDWSASCGFIVDLTPPTPPVVTPSSVFPPAGSGLPPTGYAGTSTTVAVSTTDPVPSGCTLGTCQSSGIAEFCYGLDTPPPVNCPDSVAPTWHGDGTSTADIPLDPTAWGTHTLYVEAVDNAGNTQAEPTAYTFYAPWNPATKVTAGDVSGDGIPDLLGTTKTGDLLLIHGNTDPDTTPAVASTQADSPDGTGWDNYLISHRGHVIPTSGVDDLFAYQTKTHEMYLYKNDVVADGTAGHFTKPADVLTLGKPVCAATADNTANCTNYPAAWDAVSQILAVGDVFGTGHPDLITMENKQLWLYRGAFQQNTFLDQPVLLGTGDWSHYTLIAPGTVNKTPTLWARNNDTGSVFTFPLTLDANNLPAQITTPNPVPLTAALKDSSGTAMCADDYMASTDSTNKIDIHTCNSSLAQQFTPTSDGALRVLGKCLDVSQSGTDNGTLIDLWTCNGSGAQVWQSGANGSLVNPESGKCLADPSSSTTNYTQLILYTCDGGPEQSWTNQLAADWNSHPATALHLWLPAGSHPTVTSPGDANGATASGNPDGNPDLYAVDTDGHLTEYPGSVPDSTLAKFAAPVPLGTVTNTAAAWWSLSDGSGSSATDAVAGLNATLTGGASWSTDSSLPSVVASGNPDHAVLSLDGSTGYAATTGPAVHTNASFTVSAWIKLNSLTSNSTFVSQSDAPGTAAANGFQLYYSAGAQVWAFDRHNDDTTGTSYTALYGSTAHTGQWTHLVGVYDATTGEMDLYVNGQLTGSTTYAGSDWDATGPLEIGRRLYQGSYGEYANAQISDVRLYSTALSPADAAAVGETTTVNQLS